MCVASVSASATGYDAKVLSDVFIPAETQVDADFTLVQSLGNCEDDCTTLGSNVCDSNCHGKGLCWFSSDATKAMCSGTFGVIQITEGPDTGKYIDCCKGKPYTPVKAIVEVPSKDVVVTKKPVLYKGKFINMVLVVFKAGQQ